MAHSRDEVVRELKNLVLELKKSHDIREAYLFGSYARNNPGPHSDVDIAIIVGTFRDGSPMDERFDIFHEVQEKNSLFEVVCLTQDEFSNEEMLLVRHIRQEGIRIA